MHTPAIKGAVIKVLIQDARDAIAVGRISREDAERTLTPEEFALLDEELVDTGWYSIHSYRRFTELLDEHLGGGDRRYFQGRGAAVAERLLALGVYQQVSFLQRVGRAETFAIASQNLKLTATMWNNFFNFGVWSTSHDADRRVITLSVTESEHMPPLGWEAIEGFVRRLSEEVGGQVDSRVITMTREQTGVGSVSFVFAVGVLSAPPPKPSR